MARARSNSSKNSSADLGFEAKLGELIPGSARASRAEIGAPADLLKAAEIPSQPYESETKQHRSKDKDDDPALRDWQFGVPPRGNANSRWVQHFIHHLAPHGMAGFVPPRFP